MQVQIMDGNACSKDVRNELYEIVKNLPSRPRLEVVMVGDDRRSLSYVGKKKQAAEEVGIVCNITNCDVDISEKDLVELVRSHSNDRDVNGLIVQLPLPNFDVEVVVAAIDPLKDVDGFHPENQGRLLRGVPRLIPATPFGIIELLRRYNHTTKGKHVVIVGHSKIVGRPLAAALLCDGEMGNATVTVAHIHTRDLQEHCLRADILITAIGQAEFFDHTFVNPGAVVVDVGINFKDGKMVGDVNFNDVREVVSAITPVPGGVGPMTVAMLLYNTVEAYKQQK